MSVYYKFRSTKDFDTVRFDGLHISVGQLKKDIIQQKRIGKDADYELQIIDAQTKEVYESDEALVRQNSSVLVSRIPIVGARKKKWLRERATAKAREDAVLAADDVSILKKTSENFSDENRENLIEDGGSPSFPSVSQCATS